MKYVQMIRSTYVRKHGVFVRRLILVLLQYTMYENTVYDEVR